MRFFLEIKKYWKFAVYAAKSDLQEEVANSYLNWLWWILEPLSSMLIFVMIFGIVFRTDEMYFPAFVFIGITVWDYFNRCITSSVDLIRNNQHIISRVYIPKYILLVQRMLVLGFKMLICWVIVVVSDLSRLIAIVLNLMFYMTGIFYNIKKSFPEPFGYLLQRINPVAHLIFCMRKSLLYNEMPSGIMLGVWFGISVLLAAGGICLINKNENSYVKMI